MAAPGAPERMVVAMARAVRDGTLVGQGVNSVLPSLAIALARRTHAPGATAVNIGGGVDVIPTPLPPSSAAPQWMAGTPIILSNAQQYGHFFRGRFDLFFSSGVQIDGQGRINLTVIGDLRVPRVRLPGAAGLPVIFQVVRRIVLWRTRHTPRALVETLDFVSAAGNVEQLVTPLCVFRMRDGRLRLHQLMPGVSEAEVRAQTGFAVTPWPDGVSEVPSPTARELALLDELDPDRQRDLDFHER
jgi:glutaconate CoA-transferase subunit B